MSAEKSLDYYKQRELVERAAARNASCEASRLVHEQLAERYSQLVRRG